MTLTEQEQQHPEGRSAPVRAQLLPNSLLQPGHKDCSARPHLKARDHRHSSQEEKTRLVSSLWEISQEPGHRGLSELSALNSRNRFAKGFTVEDLGQKQGLGKSLISCGACCSFRCA